VKEHKFCKVHNSIRLNPDFTSTGIECGDCGIVFGQPEKYFPLIPTGVIALVQIWNDYWDISSCDEHLDDDTKKLVENNIFQAGLELEKIINQYYSCYPNMKNWKLFQVWKHYKT